MYSGTGNGPNGSGNAGNWWNSAHAAHAHQQAQQAAQAQQAQHAQYAQQQSFQHQHPVSNLPNLPAGFNSGSGFPPPQHPYQQQNVSQNQQYHPGYPPHHQPPSDPVCRNSYPHNAFPATAHYSFPMMQSPEPSMGSPNQPYSNNSTSYSPTRNMTSPIGHPLGSPMRQFSGYQQGPPSVGQQGGPPTTPSPHRFPQSPHSIPAQSPHPVAPSPQMVPPSSQTIPPSPSSSSQPRTTSANPFSPPVSAAPTTHRTVTTNGPSSSSPVPSPTKPTEIPAKLVIDEEPLPQYPTPEELERMAQHVRPMIPYSLTEKIMSKAGVQFADPKIGNLISFAGQSLIVDIVKEVAGMSKGLPKPQDKQLMRANLERVLQDRGMKVLPPDPTPTLLK